jgi:coenzyme F420 biosynthesis associated uncharacterized protein
MRRAFRRGIALGAASGLAAVLLVEATRPRGGTAVLLDWDEVTRIARARLREERMDVSRLKQAAARYNRFAAELRAPLLETVGGTAGTALPPFEALDRAGWLDLNVQILRRVLEPLTGLRAPRSWLTDVGRAGIDRYVAAVLEYLGRRVLGQFDPQLLTRETRQEALYLVEPNVEDWERRADLDGDDLRRWLILHELTHAWQFGAHPWLRPYIDGQLEELVSMASGRRARVRSIVIGGPGQLTVMRRMQAAMSLVEGYGNLVMSVLGRDLLRSFDRLDRAYRERSGQRSPMERLVWRLTGLGLKMEQYRTGESFARTVHDRYGMDVLNRAWEGPDALPTAEELRDPDRWYRRTRNAGA